MGRLYRDFVKTRILKSTPGPADRYYLYDDAGNASAAITEAQRKALDASQYRSVVQGLGVTASANVAAIQAALDATGYAVLPPNADVLIDASIVVPSGGVLDLNSGRLYTTTNKLNLVVSFGTVAPTVRNGTIQGNDTGSQPANIPSPVIGSLANSGCGVIFAGVSRGLIENLTLLDCGGDRSNADKNGVAGVWLTYGTTDTKVVSCIANGCRNGFNEDNYFSAPPDGNQFIGCVARNNEFGGASDNGGLGRGALWLGGEYSDNVASGLDMNNAVHCRIIGVSAIGNGTWGCRVYGSSDHIHMYGNDWGSTNDSGRVSLQSTGQFLDTFPSKWESAGIYTPQLTVGFTNIAQASTSLFGGHRRNDLAQNDYIEWQEIKLQGGTYRFELAHVTALNVGIFTVSIDGVTVGTIDGYSAGSSASLGSISSIAVQHGVHRLRLTMATKNASSSAYRGLVSGVSLIRTA